MTEHAHCQICSLPVIAGKDALKITGKDGFIRYVHDPCIRGLKSAIPCLAWNLDEETFMGLVKVINA